MVNVRTLEEILEVSLSQDRFSMFLFAALAALAFFLAVIGIYSVLAYSIRRRVHEIAVRMALGARVSDVLRLVVFEGRRPAVAGLALGIAGAYALSGILAKLIFGVSETDPWTFARVALLLGSVSLVACVVPAYRATRVDPVRALRDE